MNGYIDVCTSRRTHFETAYYWKRKDEEDLSELEFNTKCYGSFSCKESNLQSAQKSIVQDTFLASDMNVQIETMDENEVKQGDYVKYLDKMWYVDSVQYAMVKKSRQYMSTNRKKTIIYLRGNAE